MIDMLITIPTVGAFIAVIALITVGFAVGFAIGFNIGVNDK